MKEGGIKELRSDPTLANPVYLTGYIEQMGTGTTDIIELCEKSGLRTPVSSRRGFFD